MKGCTIDKSTYIYFLRLLFSVTTIVLSQLILHNGLMNEEGQQNNLSCQNIEIRAGIRIEVVGQPNILVPLGRFTTYAMNDMIKMEMRKTSYFSAL